MEAVVTPSSMSPEQYLEIERAAESKSEYIAGEMIAMPPFGLAHESIVVNLTAQLHNALRGKPARVHGGRLRICVGGKNYLYADLTVNCEKPAVIDDTYADTLLNPAVIFEIFSEATLAWDHGIKWRLYQQIESLQEYVLIDQDIAHVEVRTRRPDGDWLAHTESGLDGMFTLASVDATIALSGLYEDVDVKADVTDLA